MLGGESLRWLALKGCGESCRACLTRMNSLVPTAFERSLVDHGEHPYVFDVNGKEFSVNYLPAESDTAMFGGNSNWRGPVWMPVNALLIRALLSYYLYYGDSFKIACPTGSGNQMNLFEVAREIANRLTPIFLRDKTGRRPVYGGAGEVSNLILTGRTTSCSTNISTETTVLASERAIKPAGRAWWQN